MKKIGKSTFFIVVALIALFSFSAIVGLDYSYGDNSKTYIKGVDDIRLGIDIKGGVDATFEPADGEKANETQLKAATEIIKTRLATLGINDSEVYSDKESNRIIVRFPWQAGEDNFDPKAAVKELGEMAKLTFRKGTDTTTNENGETVPSGTIVIEGTDISEADAGYQQMESNSNPEHVVRLTLNPEGVSKFSAATAELAGSGTPISIWMDNVMISAPSVKSAITDGVAYITGDFTSESAQKLADQINGGALPFKMNTVSTNTISPTMGEGSLDAIMLAAAIAFACIALYMLVLYRLPGFVAVIALCGQVTGSIAAVTGWFGFMPGSTLTIPGIAGIILAVGMGVDANIITGERIKEEIRSGKSLDSAIKIAYKKAFSAILDGNITNVIIAAILMGAFGVPSSFFSKILNSTIFRMFGASAEGFVYSFGFTLLAGVVLNFVMGVFASRLMVTSLSKFNCFKNRKLYGGDEKSPIANVKAYNFCGKKKMILGIVIGVLVALILGIIIRGVNFAIEFKGGTMLTYSYSGDIDTKAVEAVVKEQVDTHINVRTGEDVNTGDKQFTISFTSEEGFNADKQAALTDALKAKFASNELKDTESNDVNPSTGREFFIKCIIAILFAALLVIIYIAIRFRKIGGWSAGICSVFALCHDLVVALAVSILFVFEFNSNTVAVILTILGYSINNTIVIYDRIRENRTLMAKASLNDVINMGCTQSLTRSIRTSLTTIFTMLVITIVALIQGYSSLLTFSVPLMAGLISGVYTSLFVAPVTWSWWKIKSKAKKAVAKK